MGKVEDEEAKGDAENGGFPMRTAEEVHVNRVKAIPSAAPNHDKAECDPEVFRQVFQRVLLEFCCHMAILSGIVAERDGIDVRRRSRHLACNPTLVPRVFSRGSASSCHEAMLVSLLRRSSLVVKHFLGKEKTAGPIPASGSAYPHLFSTTDQHAI